MRVAASDCIMHLSAVCISIFSHYIIDFIENGMIAFDVMCYYIIVCSMYGDDCRRSGENPVPYLIFPRILT